MSARPLMGGEVNETLLVTTASGGEFVVRRAPEVVEDWHPTVEGVAAAIRLAHDAGVPVPEVVFAEGRVLAYRYVPGHMMTEREAAAGLAREAGRLHGRLHSIVGDGVGPVQPDGRSPRWPDEYCFGDVESRAGALPDSAGEPLRRLADEAAALFREHRPTHEPRLARGDSTLANTLVADGRVVALIDFDDAWFGHPAGDLAWWWWSSPDTADEFAAGCGETNRETPAPVMWLFRLHLLLGLANAFAASQPRTASRITTLLDIAVDQARREL